MLARYHHRLAVAVAFFGQLVVTFGLPVPISTKGLAPCGCAPQVRETGCCCCTNPSPGGCCATEAVASCCQTKAEPVVWVGGVLSQTCRGPLAGDVSPATYTAIPPNPPAGWSFEPVADELVLSHPTFAPGPSLVPDPPPPKSFPG